MTPTFIFDLYNLLVNQLFGSVWLSIFGVAFVLIIILLLTRTSTMFLIYWMMFYIIVMTSLYLGALGLVFGFILSFTYFAIALIRLFFRQV